MSRTRSIDLLRGFIMIAMALDHASAMVARVHFGEMWGVSFDPYPSLAWWFTRFVSHLCAPGFFFLMGMSIILFAEKRKAKGWTSTGIRKYFLKRGVVLLLMMIFLEIPAWGIAMTTGQPEGGPDQVPGLMEGFVFPTTVLYGLGMCMIISAFLTRISKGWLVAISLLSFVLSGVYLSGMDPVQSFHTLEHLFLVPGASSGVMVLYPVIPWLGVTTFGMLWGRLMIERPQEFYKISFYTGLVFITLFAGLRFWGIGNFQVTAFSGWLSFFTLIKYPPGLDFILITSGINLLLLVLFDKWSGRSWLNPVLLFGQTAMFFYILHLYLYALIGIPFPEGVGIGWLYLAWLAALPVLYFFCRRFLSFKRSKPAGSLWRMI